MGDKERPTSSLAARQDTLHEVVREQSIDRGRIPAANGTVLAKSIPRKTAEFADRLVPGRHAVSTSRVFEAINRLDGVKMFLLAGLALEVRSAA